MKNQRRRHLPTTRASRLACLGRRREDMAKFFLVMLLVTILAHQRVLGEFEDLWNDQLCLVCNSWTWSVRRVLVHNLFGYQAYGSVYFPIHQRMTERKANIKLRGWVKCGAVVETLEKSTYGRMDMHVAMRVSASVCRVMCPRACE